MPMDSRLYQPNWEQAARSLKEACGWRCQWCGLVQPDLAAGRAGDWTLNRFGESVPVQVGVAHLDHDPWNPRARLLVLCRACHIRYDARERRRKRWRMQIARGQQLLWEEVIVLGMDKTMPRPASAALARAGVPPSDPR